ncbi:unnamed protein product [Rhizophagus irregularis]|uniref:Uncharacterized protein n=1 Tax=Rhizophagus irregularis TaxID=588596 RepID=A0A915ZQQ7_9GLOM|nr:unnamed protein product [Rhizophagus irregularis]CAB5383991.1 unnamed protein product [Rhizophagus irregularis]
MRIFLTKSYSHFNKKPAEDLTKEMMMTLEKYVPQFIIKIMYLQRNSIIYMIQFQFFFSVSIIFNLIGRTFDTLYYKIPFF